MTSIRSQVARLASRLGAPEQDQVILGEGNASGRHDSESFWVKASGTSMSTIDENGFVQVKFAPILAAYETTDLSDAQVREALLASKVDPADPRMPSVETFFHAWLLTLPEVNMVGHTHASSVLAMMCFEDSEALAQLRLFPDEVVCCGPASAHVPYVDPGIKLSLAIKESVLKYVDQHGAIPRVIVMQNHGLIALGKNGSEIESALFMAQKAARVKLAALQTGRTITAMTAEQIERIHSRPDEHYRQRLIWQLSGQEG